MKGLIISFYNRNDRVFNIPLKSVKSALVSRLIFVSDMNYLTAAIAEKIYDANVLKSKSLKCPQKYLA